MSTTAPSTRTIGDFATVAPVRYGWLRHGWVWDGDGRDEWHGDGHGRYATRHARDARRDGWIRSTRSLKLPGRLRELSLALRFRSGRNGCGRPLLLQRARRIRPSELPGGVRIQPTHDDTTTKSGTRCDQSTSSKPRRDGWWNGSRSSNNNNPLNNGMGNGIGGGPGAVEICRAYLAGRCSRGAACRFVHVENGSGHQPPNPHVRQRGGGRGKEEHNTHRKGGEGGGGIHPRSGHCACACPPIFLPLIHDCSFSFLCLLCCLLLLCCCFLLLLSFLPFSCVVIG